MATVALSGIITPTNVVTAASTTTLTNKTIAYGSNTLTDVVGVTATQTLTNKTLTAPTIASANLTTALTLAGAAGTNGQVLTSAGSGLPTWASPSSGAMVFLSSVTASSSATVDIETGFGSTYDTYMLIASDIDLATDNNTFGMRLKIGGAYLSGANYNSNSMQSTSGSVTFVGVADNAQDRVLIASDQGSAAGNVANFSMFFGPTSGTTNYKQFYWTGVYTNPNGAAGSQISLTHGSGSVTANTGALTGVRFLAGAGNITSGTFRLYGIVKS
jgi:hypothetical protein